MSSLMEEQRQLELFGAAGALPPPPVL